MTEMEALKSSYFNGVADAESVARLGNWLCQSPENAREFALDALIVQELRGRRPSGTDVTRRTGTTLRLLTTDESVAPAEADSTSLRSEWWMFWRMTAAAAAACVLVAVSAALLTGRSAPARLMAEVNARWDGDAPDGSGLEPGRVYRLESGLAQVETTTGALLVVEGPCEVAINGANATLLNRGKLTARCSTKETHGFTVTTPTGRVVDLGTEFGVEHNEQGTFAYVFDGEVQAFSDTSRRTDGRVIRAGEGVRISPRGAEPIGDLGWAPEFVTVSDFRVALSKASGAVAERWTGYYERLREDPDLVFWTDFDASNKLGRPMNLCRYGDGRHKLLARVDPTYEAGRLRANDAVRLLDGDARPVVRVPGIFRSLTLGAWVRVAESERGDDGKHRGLLLSDWSLPGSLHWQLKGNALRLTYPNRGSDNHASFSTELPESFFDGGAWRLLVTVIETGPGGRVRHYLDGELLGEVGTDPASPQLRLGDCEVGGWSKPDDSRPLDGLMDDLLVWRRPLAAAEVEQLYDDGRVDGGPFGLTN